MSDETKQQTAPRRRRNAEPDGNPLPPGDVLPPHSSEAEQAVLGCMLLAPTDCIPEAVERLKEHDRFYDLKHQVLFDELVEMWKAGKHVDLITVPDWLKARKLLDDCGGRAYVASHPDVVPSAAMMGTFMDTLHELWCVRRTIQVCSAGLAEAYERGAAKPQALLDRIDADLLDIRNQQKDGTEKSLMEALKEWNAKCMDRYTRGGGQLLGPSWGFESDDKRIDGYLDKLTSGLVPTDMIVVAARPGCGKTAFALNVAKSVAQQGVFVHFFSLEMTADALAERMVHQQAGADLNRTRTGYATDHDFQNLVVATSALGPLPLLIDDASTMTTLTLRAKARRVKAQKGTGLIVIDYLQLLKASGRHFNREQEVAEISATLRELAKDLNVPVLVLAQLNRESEKNGKRPKLSDLRESGQIEQDAATVLMLHDICFKDTAEEEVFWAKAEEECGQDWSDQIKRIDAEVVKNRHGPADTKFQMIFRKKCVRFEPWEKPADFDAKVAIRREAAKKSKKGGGNKGWEKPDWGNLPD